MFPVCIIGTANLGVLGPVVLIPDLAPVLQNLRRSQMVSFDMFAYQIRLKICNIGDGSLEGNILSSEHRSKDHVTGLPPHTSVGKNLTKDQDLKRERS